MAKKRDEEYTGFDPSIDKDRLDVEWVNQPDMFHKYAVKLANAKRDLDIAKNSLEVTHAEVERSVRQAPDKYDIFKVTEASVAAAVLVDQEYKDAQNDVINAKHKVDILQAAVGALDHRKRALENLVELFGMDYWAPPRTKGMREVEQKSIKGVKRRKDEDE